MISDFQFTLPSSRQIDEFNTKIDEWATNETQSNPNNSANIRMAKDKISECFSRSSNSEFNNYLDLTSLRLKSLPIEIFNIANLQTLTLYDNQLTSLPNEIGNLTNLETLILNNNQLTSLPNEIGNLTNLKTLILSGNQLTALPRNFSNLTALSQLNLNNNRLTILPDAIGNLTNLTNLFLYRNRLTTLPESIGNLESLVDLNLRENQLTTLPPSIGNLTNLGNLYLNQNQLTTLPPSIGNLTNLGNFYLSDNQLTYLPDTIGNLTNLGNLYLDQNELTTLPISIGNLAQFGNFRIIGLPPHISIPTIIQPIIPPSLHLIESLCISANFSNEEKTQPYKSFLSLESLTQESEESQALTARLGAMLEFFHSSSSQDSRYESAQGHQAHNAQDQTPDLILAINSFISRSTSWRNANQERKEHLARYLLTILSQVYERKEDKIFLEQVEIVCRDSLETCEDRNSLFIFNLANFCQRKNADDLNLMAETQPSQLFDYFKNQLLYNHFLDLGQEKVNQIKIESHDFSEDVEVLLNYLRIYNNKFGSFLKLQLPNISDQKYFDSIQYQPSPEQIAEFNIIADKFSQGDSSLLNNHLALILTEFLDKKLSTTNPEILEISFVKNHIKQIENIAQEFLSLFEDHKQQREENDQEMTDGEYNQKMKEINEFKKQIDKEELKIFFQNSLSQLASNNNPSKEFTKEKLDIIEKKFASFFKDTLKINLTKQADENGEMAWKTSPSPTPKEGDTEVTRLLQNSISH